MNPLEVLNLIKEKIITENKISTIKYPDLVDYIQSDKVDKETEFFILKLLFQNIRKNKDDYSGIMLSNKGNTIMGDLFESISYKFKEKQIIKPRHLIFLSNNSKMPYFYDSKKITLYDIELGLMFKLHGNSIDLLSEIYFDNGSF